MEYVTFFVYAFTSVFAIVNPLGGMTTFLSLTNGLKEEERRRVARLSVTVAFVIALVFALAGELVLRLFNITVDSLRVAGGILLLLVAIDMLLARTSRESMTPEEMRDASKRDSIAVFPIATPLLTGPGAITAVIVVIRTGGTIGLKLVAVTAICLTFLLSYLIFRFAPRIYRLLGVTASMVITRIMGLLLGAIAVNFITIGLWNIYRTLTGS